MKMIVLAILAAAFAVIVVIDTKRKNSIEDKED